MNQQALLVLAVIGVGVFHTLVPDHWVPIALMARQSGWTRRRTALAALVAGTGHVISTLFIGLVVWAAGVAFAHRFGQMVSWAASFALIVFGVWIALASLREIRAKPHPASEAVAQPLRTRLPLLLIVGSSPMIESIPAFLAAARFGAALIAVMSVAFAIATIATYVSLCVASAGALQQLSLGRFERYGEVISGAFIALVGFVFLLLSLG